MFLLLANDDPDNHLENVERRMGLVFQFVILHASFVIFLLLLILIHFLQMLQSIDVHFAADLADLF